MKKYKRQIGFFCGIIVCAVICLIPISGLSQEGKYCLGFTLMTVIWWATQVAQAAYVSGAFLALLCIFRVAEPSAVFSAWSGSTIWLVAGAYLIATTVKHSGLGERLSYSFLLRFVRGWRSILISVFVLTLILSLLIPHPWPRAFLIMSVMSVLIKSAKLPKKDAITVGFSVFAASIPVSLIFLTGDATVNPLIGTYANEEVSFVRWLMVMGPPALLLSGLTLLLIFLLFRPSAPVSIQLEEVRAAKDGLGKMSSKEKRTVIWLAIAIGLWLTNGITGLDLGWVTLLVAMLMSMPVIGGGLTAQDWSEVPVNVMVSLTATIAIGKVGSVTGMNAWLANTFFPSNLPESRLLLCLCISVLSVLLHMVMGSVIATLGVAIPAFLTLVEGSGISPLVVGCIVYLSVGCHYLLPFHHLNILVGQGEANGMYTQKETLRLGLPLFVALLATIAFSVFWWTMLGLM